MEARQLYIVFSSFQLPPLPIFVLLLACRQAKCPPSEAEKQAHLNKLLSSSFPPNASVLQLHAANPGKPSDVTASRDSAVESPVCRRERIE